MRRLIWLIGALVLVGLLSLVAITTWRDWSRPWIPDTAGRPPARLIRIPNGSTLPAVTDTLVQQGLLQHPGLFRLVARLTGRDRQLQAGRYAVPVGVSPRELLDLLVTGQTLPLRVTLPEGIDAESAAAIVAADLACDAGEFLVVADSMARAVITARRLLGGTAAEAAYDSLMNQVDARIPRKLHWSEGYLAPDTYHFAEGTSARKAAQTIVALGVARLDSAFQRRADRLHALALSPHQLLTLASIVEAEARRDEERTKIAAVYVNRLDRGWRLEADPCVAYLLDKRGQRLFYKDLAVDSPYNTYRHAGLPPGPICCPGPLSLQAAAAPAADNEIMFFVSNAEGGHVFSRTRQEHEAAVREFRQKRRHGGR